MNGQHDRTPNRALLRELASLLTSESWVENTTVFPANRPDSIVISLERQYYPRKYVSEAYIEVQSYTNGDFHISYVEDHHGERWLCRWDRHDSEDYTRDHFHAPPGARHEDGENREYPASLWTVISQVVAPWVYERMGAVWDEFDS
ncbi:hypothetical protein [Salinigranum halophilum]|uniref:hypothetical protein n=1 Tax=Salinigranum halophilum TaxID=2565931 RepID=UPI0010A8ECF4|nr:hypothetical protein [Salinigranum halophilum]